MRTPADHLAKILGNTEPPKYRDDITCFAPIHFACMTGDEKVLVYLLQAGADPNLRTHVYAQIDIMKDPVDVDGLHESVPFFKLPRELSV